MNNTNRILKRGTVWWSEDCYEFTDVQGISSKVRPVMIISNNERGRSPIVEVLKLTTTDKSETCSSINIPVINGSRKMYIMCNQHYTVSINSLTQYIFTVDLDTMNKVEKGVLLSMGMIKYYDSFNKVSQIKNILGHNYVATIPRQVDTKDNEESGSVVTRRKSYQRWTDESKKKFISEYENSPIDTIIKKYGFSNKNSVYSCYYRFKKNFELPT